MPGNMMKGVKKKRATKKNAKMDYKNNPLQNNYLNSQLENMALKKELAASKAAANRAVAPSSKSSGGVLQAIGKGAGGLLGGPAGSAIGELLGKGASGLFNWITGHGAYTVKSNSLVAGSTMPMDSLPQFSSASNGIRIRHREYIQDIVSSSSASTFTVSAFPIQPAYTFPWLSTVAEQFQQYQINGMIFEFKTTSSDALNSTNTALGEIILSTQYNVNTAAPVNPQQMYQLEFVSTCKPSESVLHPIECSKGESPFVVLDTRNGSAASYNNADLRLYDFGNFYIASNGLQGTSVNLGQLWVSYDITLLKPQLGASNDVGDHYQLNYATVAVANPLGTVAAVLSTTSDFGSVLNYVNNTITIPAYYTGNVCFILSYDGASTSSVATINFVGSAGATGLALFDANTHKSVDGTGTVARYLNVSLFKCVGGGVITLSGTVIPASLTAADLMVVSWPSTLTN